jgi:hypothetical protein
MRPVRVSVTGSPEVSPPIPLDKYANPQNTGLVVVVSGGAITYTVEHTFDEVYAEGFDPGTAIWIPHPILDGLTGTQDSNYAFPPEACRLRTTAGVGTAALTVIQSSGGMS